MSIGIGLLLLGLYGFIAQRSYHAPVYKFHGSGSVLLLSILSVVAILVWRRRSIRPMEWILPAAAIALTMCSFPDTSRDYLRYLLDGEMIRLWHLSPYLHLPAEFPLDLYARAIGSIWWTSIPSPYGPMWQAIMVAINFISGNTVLGGVIALKLLDLAAVLACARYLFAISGKPYLSFLFLMNPIVLLNTVGTPHSDIIIAAAVLAAVHGTSAAGRGLALASAGLIKIPALLFVPFLDRRARTTCVIVAWTTTFLGGLLLALKPVVGYNVFSMLRASADGGVDGTQSLLMHSLLPGANTSIVYLASYLLFFACYIAIGIAFWRRSITAVDALGLTSLSVPLCLTGLLLPWHFIIPLTLLLLNSRPLALWAILFLTLLVLRSATTALELLVLAAIFGLGEWITARMFSRVSSPPGFTRHIASYLR